MMAPGVHILFKQLLKESEGQAEELKKMKQQNKLPEVSTNRQGQTTNQKDRSNAKGGKVVQMMMMLIYPLRNPE